MIPQTINREEALTIENCPEDLPNGMATILTVQKQPHCIKTVKARLDDDGYVRPLNDRGHFFRADEWEVVDP